MIPRNHPCLRYFSCLLAFLLLTLGIALGADTPKPPAIKAIAFDAFPIFDPREVDAVALKIYPEQGPSLVQLWRTRQFEYQWLRVLGGEYKDFLQTTEAALVFATRQLKLPLSPENKAALMAPFLNLSAWPDAKPALEKLKARGYKLIFLSNMTEPMLQRAIVKSDLENIFDAIGSTDERQTFKPSPQAYQIALDKLDLSREEILFVAFAGWDVAGAKWFGFPTFWLNRAGTEPEELDAQADGSGRNLEALLDFLESRGSLAPQSTKP